MPIPARQNDRKMEMPGVEPLFIFERGKYRPTDWARGPWEPGLLHGGATAALLAHALDGERCDPALWRTTRITIDLLRPVRTAAALSVRTQRVRQGKRIQLGDAFLFDDDTLVARASGLVLRRTDGKTGATAAAEQRSIPSWKTLAPCAMGSSEEARLFHCGTEFRPVPKTHPGQTFAVWIRIPYSLLPDQPLTRLECTAAISDYVNAISSMANSTRGGFINADISLNLHREPEGEWLCLENIARPDHAGIATSNVLLHDAAGLLGAVSACCLANPLPKTFGSEIGIAE